MVRPVALIESMIANRLFARLGAWCRDQRLGQVMLQALFEIPGSGNDHKPDVAFVSFARWAAGRPLPRVNAWPVAPDLAAEVVGPTVRAFDVIDKVQEYFAGGVRQVWHVHSHAGQVFVFDSPTAVRVLTRADELTAEPVVPGFRVPVADMFPLVEPDPPTGPRP